MRVWLRLSASRLQAAERHDAEVGTYAMSKATTVPRWYALRDAAPMLGVSPDALRKLFERRAARASDGGTEARVDGVRARKFANRWRVSFGKPWTE